VFLDHAETLIEQGGSMVLLSASPKTFWPQLIVQPAPWERYKAKIQNHLT